MTEISHLGGWEDSVACPQAGHSEFDSLAPSTCWKERTYSWKLPLDHHICSVALYGHSSEPNKCSKNMIPENLSMVVKPVILALRGWKVTVWGPPELHEKRKKGRGRNKKRKQGRKEKEKEPRRERTVFSRCTSCRFLSPCAVAALLLALQTGGRPCLVTLLVLDKWKAFTLCTRWDPPKLLVLALWHQGTVLHNILELCLNFSKCTCF